MLPEQQKDQIRHTQKKPRQVIALLNILLTCAERASINVKHIPSEFIKTGIHAKG
jgi:hypothetical protein